MLDYIHPAFRNDPSAEAFACYLADNLDWTSDEFGGGYAWSVSIPPRSEWEREVIAFNDHLATL